MSLDFTNLSLFKNTRTRTRMRTPVGHLSLHIVVTVCLATCAEAISHINIHPLTRSERVCHDDRFEFSARGCDSSKSTCLCVTDFYRLVRMREQFFYSRHYH